MPIRKVGSSLYIRVSRAKNFQSILQRSFRIATACKSAHQGRNSSRCRPTLMAEVWRDGKMRGTDTCTARSSKARCAVPSAPSRTKYTNDIQWQQYDPWDLSGRLDANMNIYESPGGCSIFRSFQGWLDLSCHGPIEGESLLLNFKPRTHN